MTTTVKSAGTRKGAGARAEKNGKPKSTKFRGLTLTLPADLGCEVGYAFAELEGSELQVKPLIDFIESLIGAEQMAEVKAKQVKDRVKFNELAGDLETLLDQVYAAYGTTMGKSSASETS